MVSICWPYCERQKAINHQQPGHLCSCAVICLSWTSATRSSRKASIKSEICARAVVFPISLSLSPSLSLCLSLECLSSATRGTDGKTQDTATFLDTPWSWAGRRPFWAVKSALLGTSELARWFPAQKCLSLRAVNGSHGDWFRCGEPAEQPWRWIEEGLSICRHVSAGPAHCSLVCVPLWGSHFALPWLFLPSSSLQQLWLLFWFWQVLFSPKMLILRILGSFFKCVWVDVDNSLHRETSSICLM